MIVAYVLDVGALRAQAVAEGEALPEAAVWIDLIQPTRDDELRVERLAGIDVPTREEMREIEPSALRLRLAAVFQDSVLFHGTIGDNIALSATRADRDGLLRAVRDARADDIAGDAECVVVVLGKMVGHAADAGMHIGTAKRFGIDHFAGGGFYQWRAAEKDRALILDDHRFIAHRRHISTAGGG